MRPVVLEELEVGHFLLEVSVTSFETFYLFEKLFFFFFFWGSHFSNSHCGIGTKKVRIDKLEPQGLRKKNT